MYGPEIVDIRSKIADIRTLGPRHTCPEPPTDPKDETRATIKAEFYALSNILAEAVVDRALQTTLQVTPDRMRDICRVDIDSDDALLDAYSKTKIFCVRALHSAEIEIEGEIDEARKRGETDNFLVQVHDRYMELEKVANPEGENIRILQGLSTTSTQMPNILRVIRDVDSRGKIGARDNKRLIQIAADSYGVIGKLSLMHIDDFSSFVKRGIASHDVFNPSYDQNLFQIRRIGKREILDFKKAPEKKGEYAEPRIGCPARGDAIKKMWDWFVSVAPIVYEEDVPLTDDQLKYIYEKQMIFDEGEDFLVI